ncbi:MAG: hypothetical protein AB7O26_01735 [Planctomycetaceae bacterium]
MKQSLHCLLALLLTTSLAGCCACAPYGGYPGAYDPCGGPAYCGPPAGSPCGPAYGPGCCILTPVFHIFHGVESAVCSILHPCGPNGIYGGCGNNYCGVPSACDPCCAPNLCCDPCGPVCGDPCWDSCCPAPICCPPANCCPTPCAPACGPAPYGMGDCNTYAPAPMSAPPAPAAPPAAAPQGAYFQRSGLIQSSAQFSDARNQRWLPERY